MKSSPNNRINAIMEALLEAHEEAQQVSHSSLHRMPEYFMTMRVADYFAKNFLNFGYRLEAQVRRTFEASDMNVGDISELLEDTDLRSDGRFDLVIHTGKKGRPAHILEFKRKDSNMQGIISDMRRLAKISCTAKRHSLKTNYLVLTRNCQEEKDTVDNLIRRIDTVLDEHDMGDVEVNVIASDPMVPYLNSKLEPVAGRAFQIVILEIQG
ncbi:hypothetical protein [Vreelandella hamiltonii]|uniref:Uncharacterized protein n=1 Tax=Vreelandella hamiltonii TaxID=502829 RepID=A0A8H9I341_9GAMM|nr:hypothetical protein [Halomonas hamiltonii]GGW21521.1 hypothetical protein GCM10007157_08870 [Halomonas hamiltonii]